MSIEDRVKSRGALACNCTAMVLAAGYGTRLQPLTSTLAKAVVPFLNRPLLDYTLDWLSRFGFTKAIVNLHHRPESVQACYREKQFGIDVHFSLEESILGTAGGPRKVLERLGPRVLIVNGDVATTITPEPLWEHHSSSGALATMALHAGPARREFPGIKIDKDGGVTHIPGVGAGKSDAGDVASGCFTGIHIVEQEVLMLAPENKFCGIVDPIYARLLQERLPLHGFVVPGSWYEIGTPGRYVSCQLEALRREEFPLAFQGYQRLGPGSYGRELVGPLPAGTCPPFMIDKQVKLEEASLISGVVIGSEAYVGRGASVLNSVLMKRAKIGAGAYVERCTILEDAVVPSGARCVNQVIAPEVLKKT
mgnify:CR=1 FL=1